MYNVFSGRSSCILKFITRDVGATRLRVPGPANTVDVVRQGSTVIVLLRPGKNVFQQSRFTSFIENRYGDCIQDRGGTSPHGEE